MKMIGRLQKLRTCFWSPCQICLVCVMSLIHGWAAACNLPASVKACHPPICKSYRPDQQHNAHNQIIAGIAVPQD
eukprot:scaffold308613_cov27-Prasinocladus_malaysianus.AAC.1